MAAIFIAAKDLLFFARRGETQPMEKQIQRHAALLLLLLAPSGASAEHNPLLPRPQRINYASGALAVRSLEIRLPSDAAAEDRFAAEELSSSLSRIVGSPFFVSECGSTGKAITLRRTGALDPLPTPGENGGPDSRESYSIKVTPAGAEVEGRSSAAVYYGAQTLIQLAEGTGEAGFRKSRFATGHRSRIAGL